MYSAPNSTAAAMPWPFRRAAVPPTLRKGPWLAHCCSAAMTPQPTVRRVAITKPIKPMA